MAYAVRVEAQSSVPGGVVWSTRRAHLAVVAPVPSAPRPRATAAQYRRRRRWVALGASCVLSSTIFAVASWADRQVGEPLGDPRPAIPWVAPVGHTGP